MDRGRAPITDTVLAYTAADVMQYFFDTKMAAVHVSTSDGPALSFIAVSFGCVPRVLHPSTIIDVVAAVSVVHCLTNSVPLIRCRLVFWRHSSSNFNESVACAWSRF